MIPTFKLHSDRAEFVPYTVPELFFFAGGRTLNFDASREGGAIGHWHDEIELILVEEGGMVYNVNGTRCAVNANEGIFVNARQLHFFEESRCTYQCLLLHPMMLCANTYLEENYIAPVTQNGAFPYCVLKPENEIAALFPAFFEAAAEKDLLRLQSLSYTLWGALLRLMPKNDAAPRENSRLSAVKDMMHEIQTRYAEKLTLEEIAAAGHVCKSACEKLFRTYLHCTPVEYLLRYRLQEAAESLTQTDATVAQIALDCGFSGASYFSGCFKTAYGCTPKAYRAAHKNGET